MFGDQISNIWGEFIVSTLSFGALRLDGCTKIENESHRLIRCNLRAGRHVDFRFSLIYGECFRALQRRRPSSKFFFVRPPFNLDEICRSPRQNV